MRSLRATNVIILPMFEPDTNRIVLSILTKPACLHKPVYYVRKTITLTTPDSVALTIPDSWEATIKSCFYFLSALLVAFLYGSRSIVATVEHAPRYALTFEAISFAILFLWVCWLTGKGAFLCLDDIVGR